MNTLKLPGINIQWPISQKIVGMEKSVETRTYPIPQKYLNKEVFIIETPGPKGGFKARVIGTIVFSACFKYKSADDFYSDFDRHLVTRSSPWAWNDSKGKWGWEISSVTKFECSELAPYPRGFVFSGEFEINL